MNAPEKIYICPSDLAGIDYEEEWLEFPWGDNNIEYTRTDTFIDKAIKWLEDNIDRYLYNTGGYEEYIPKCGGKMFEDFKKAMEE